MDAIRIKAKIVVISSLVELFPPRGTEGGKEKKSFQTPIKVRKQQLK